MNHSLRRAFAGLLLAASLLLPAGVAGIATAAPSAPALVSFTVNTTIDDPADFTNDAAHTICRTNVNNSLCTLRAAIMNANRLPGGAIIHLPAGSYFLTRVATGQDDEASGNLNISTTVTLLGAGAGSTRVDATLIDNLIQIEPSAVVTITGLTLQGGLANTFLSGFGGAIDNKGRLNLTDSALINNRGAVAGALRNEGTATLNRVTLSNNQALSGQAGAIQNDGTLVVSNSTISRNRAELAGGGIYNFFLASLTVVASTISDNSSQIVGGGVYNDGAASFLNTTIAGNLADSDAIGSFSEGGGLFNNGGVNDLHLANTLLVDNFVSTTLNACGGPLNSQDYNLIQTISDCTVQGQTSHNVINLLVSPGLGPLAANGGPSLTRGLLPGSPALDLIPIGQCNGPLGGAPAPDQRGSARPVNGSCDIGAFEGLLPQFTYFVNLLHNGDGEASAGSPTGAHVRLAAWDPTGEFTGVVYGASGSFPTSFDAPPDAGQNFFAGGQSLVASAQQYVNVPAAAYASLDAGGVKVVLSGDLGGYGNHADYPVVTAEFLDSGFLTLSGSIQLGPVTALGRSNQTGFVHLASTPISLPAHTRHILVRIELNQVTGPTNTAFADNLALVLFPRGALWLPLVRR